MDKRHHQFLTAVLGPSGAQAVAKVATRSPDLAKALVPRTVVAWLGTVKEEHKGDLPGIPESHAEFSKSETGSYTGSITIGAEPYSFTNAKLEHLAAAVSVAIGVDRPRTALRGLDLEKLGHSLDLLARTQAAGKELAKGEKVHCHHCKKEIYSTKGGKIGYHRHGELCPGSGKDPEDDGDLEKAGMPAGPKQPQGKKPPTAGKGLPAPPLAPEAPAPAMATAPPLPKVTTKPNKPQIAKPPKPPTSKTLSVKKSEAHAECRVCGMTQFTGGSLVGCICIRSVLKSVDVTPVGLDYQLDISLLDEDERGLVFEVFKCPQQ